MTAESRAFERAVRNKTRVRLKNAPALPKQPIVAIRKIGRIGEIRPGLLLVWALVAGLVVLWRFPQVVEIADNGPIVRAGLFALTMLVTGLSFLMGGSMASNIAIPRFPFAYLPMSEQAFLSLQARNYIRPTYFVLGIAFAVYGALAFLHQLPWTVGIEAFALATLQWLGFGAVGALLAWKRFNLSDIVIGLCLMVAGIVMCLLTFLAPGIVSLTSVDWWFVVVPAGAIHQALRIALLDRDPFGWVYLAPMLPWLCILSIGCHRLWTAKSPGRALCIDPVSESNLRMDSTGATAPPLKAPTEFSQFSADQIAAIKEQLRDGRLGRRPHWTEPGWIERVVEWWLTPRQREIAEALTQGEPAWTMGWKIAMGLTVVAFLLVLAPMPDGFALVPLLTFALALVCGGASMNYFPGAEQSGHAKLQVPPYCFIPIGTEEFAGVVVKVVTIRFLGLLPTAMLLGAAVGLGRLPPIEVVALACKAGFLLLAAIPLFVSMTIDVSPMAPRNYPAWLVAPLGLCLLGAGASGFLLFGANSFLGAAFGAIVCPVCSFLLLRCHLYAYRRWTDMSMLAHPWE